MLIIDEIIDKSSSWFYRRPISLGEVYDEIVDLVYRRISLLNFLTNIFVSKVCDEIVELIDWRLNQNFNWDSLPQFHFLFLSANFIFSPLPRSQNPNVVVPSPLPTKIDSCYLCCPRLSIVRGLSVPIRQWATKTNQKSCTLASTPNLVE